MSSLLGYQVQQQRFDPWLRRATDRSGPCWIKLINPSPEPVYPLGEQHTYLARFHWGDTEPDRDLIWDGADGARAWWRETKKQMARVPWIRYVEGPNEQHIQRAVQARLAVGFERAAADLCAAQGITYVGRSHGVWWPQFDLVSILAKGWAHVGWYNGHEYGMERLVWDGVTVGRFATCLALAQQAGIDVSQVKVLSTETGLDRQGNPYDDGWRARSPRISPESMVNQYRGYDLDCQAHGQVVAIMPFVWMHDNWPSFDQGPLTVVYANLLESIRGGNVDQQLVDVFRPAIISHNCDAFLYKIGRSRGYEWAGDETRQSVNGQTYIGQWWFDVASDEHVLLSVREGHYTEGDVIEQRVAN
jgi:hypothetical protein